MKTNLLLIAILLLVACGCKTTKEQLHTKSDITTQIKTDVEVKTDSAVDVVVNELTDTKSEQTDSVVINEVTMVLSKPDSTGMQYPEQITYKETTKVKSNNQETNRARDSTAHTNYNQTLSDKTDLKSASSLTIDKETNTKVKTPSPIKRFVWVLALGALVFAYLILKRFKLIK